MLHGGKGSILGSEPLVIQWCLTELVLASKGTFHLGVQCWDLEYDPQATRGWSDATSARYFPFFYFIEHVSKKSVPQDRAACVTLLKIKHSPRCGADEAGRLLFLADRAASQASAELREQGLLWGHFKRHFSLRPGHPSHWIRHQLPLEAEGHAKAHPGQACPPG